MRRSGHRNQPPALGPAALNQSRVATQEAAVRAVVGVFIMCLKLHHDSTQSPCYQCLIFGAGLRQADLRGTTGSAPVRRRSRLRMARRVRRSRRPARCERCCARGRAHSGLSRPRRGVGAGKRRCDRDSSRRFRTGSAGSGPRWVGESGSAPSPRPATGFDCAGDRAGRALACRDPLPSETCSSVSSGDHLVLAREEGPGPAP